jgi:tRNA pseudouridine55 synthase
MHRSNTVSGFLLLDKESGKTSFASLGAVKKALDSGKVGHTGTLDKFASGLLVVLAGKALKLSPWVVHSDKTYEGTICFGAETATLDPEGSVIAEAPLPSREQVEEVLPQFRGAILQAPPEYSAIHVEGRRASELARSGETVEMKKRPVTIYELALMSWEPPLAKIYVRCSTGTYIRSLARDIAQAAGSRAHVAALRRLTVAGFSVADASGALRPIDRAFFEALGLPRFDAGEEILAPMIHGRPLGPLLAGLELHGPASGAVAGAHGVDGPVAAGGPAAGSPLAAGPTVAGPARAAAVFAGDQFAGMVERDAGANTDRDATAGHGLTNSPGAAAGWKYGYVFATHAHTAAGATYAGD